MSTLYVREGSKFVKAQDSAEILEFGAWCEEADTFVSETDYARQKYDDENCLFSSGYVSVEERCTIEGADHKHWAHYGYECFAVHNLAAVVGLEAS